MSAQRETHSLPPVLDSPVCTVTQSGAQHKDSLQINCGLYLLLYLVSVSA